MKEQNHINDVVWLRPSTSITNPNLLAKNTEHVLIDQFIVQDF